MEQRQLRQEVSELAFGYVMAGTLSEDWLGDQLAPEAIPERFREYDRLVDLHFALDSEVTAFVQNIQQHLRSIKTETRSNRSRSRDAIKGQIDWPATHQERNNRAPRDGSLFVTEQRAQAYDIPENIVLKHLLSVVHRTVSGMEEFDYDWVATRWSTGNRNEIEEFKRLYNRNIHLNRISTPEPPLPTDRMIQATKSARSSFYREAASHLEWREKLLEGNRSALQTLFQSSIIEPSADRLFELLVVFRLLQALDDRMGALGAVRPIEGGGDAIAQIGDPPVYLYHDSSGSDHDLRFPPMPTPDPEQLSNYTHQNARTDVEWLRRSQNVAYWGDKIESELWDSESDDRTRRPDAILFRPASTKDGQGASDILIVEVKHSTGKKRINNGISELLRYLAFASTTSGEPSFVFPETESQGAFGARVHGLLVVQDLSIDTEMPDIGSPIEIVGISDLAKRLPSLLSDVFGDPT